MVLNTSASLSISQINSSVFFTTGSLGVNTTSPAFNLDVNGTINASGKSTLQNISATNISSNTLTTTTNISSAALYASSSTISNSVFTNISTSSLNVSGTGSFQTLNITATTIPNAVFTNISTSSLNVSGAGSFQTLNITATTIPNAVFTNVSSGTINAVTLSANNIIGANISTGTFRGSNMVLQQQGNTLLLNGGNLHPGGLESVYNGVNFGNDIRLDVNNTFAGSNTSAKGATFVLSDVNNPMQWHIRNANTTGGFEVMHIDDTGMLTANKGIITTTLTTSTGITAGTINASGTSTFTNATATNISTGTLTASGVTNLNSNVKIVSSNTPRGLYIQASTVGNSAWQEFSNSAEDARGIIGLDGLGYAGWNTNALTIATWTNNPINFGTNQTFRGTIATNGNFGIGTSTPSALLDIQTSLSSTNTAMTNILAPNLLAGNSIRTCLLGKNSGGYNGVYQYYTHVGDNNSSNYIHWDFNGKDNAFVVTGEGRVGINKASPNYNLDVNGSINATNISSESLFINSSPTNSTTGLLAITSSSTNSTTSLLTITSSSTSGSLLDIKGENNWLQRSGLIRIAPSTSMMPATIAFYGNTDFNTTLTCGTWIMGTGVSGQYKGGDFSIYKINSAKVSLHCAAATSFVGIQNSSPEYPLDVGGSCRIGSSFQCGGVGGSNYKFSSDNDPYAYFGGSLVSGSTGDARLNIQDRVGNCISFYSASTKQGGITVGGGATSYNTSSDYRVKENVVDLQNASSRIKQFQVRRFNFVNHPEKTVDGFIAHEAAEVVPEAVHGEKDAVDSEGNPILQQIDQSKLVPLLTGALKEAILKIENLEQFIQSKFPGEYAN